MANRLKFAGSIFQSTLFTINILASVLLIVSAFSDRINPNTFILFAFLGLIFPFLLLLNLLFFLWWAFTLKGWKTLFCIIVFFICWNSINAYFAFNKTSDLSRHDDIKFLTYNTMLMEQEKPDKPDDPNDIVEFVRNSGADIVCLQEYSAYRGKNQLNTKDILRSLSAYPFYKIQKSKLSNKDRTYGLALFSKFPITSFKEIPLNSNESGSFIAELDIRAKKLAVIGNHLESNKLTLEERAEYYGLTKKVNSNNLGYLFAILTKRLKPAFKTRAKQIDIIAEEIEKNTCPYKIVCGDFNDTPVSYPVYRIKKIGFTDSFTESGNGLGVSYHKNRFYFRIDYIFHTKNIESYRTSVGKVKYSDHYPVWTFLHLN